MIVAVVLAAGASSRMGSPKALLQLGDLSLVECHIEALLPACEQVIVVVGAHKAEIRPLCRRDRVEVVENENWAKSDALESLRIGLSAFSGADCVVVTPVDAPPVSSSDLRALIGAEAPAVLSWQGTHGHPVVIGRTEVDYILARQVSGGLRSLLGVASSIPAGSSDILLNLNTPELWRSYLAECVDRN